MTLSAKPLWLVGFRPFFILACAAGAVLPMLWALIFSGAGTAGRAFQPGAVACPRDVLRLRLGRAGRLFADRHQELGAGPGLSRHGAGRAGAGLVCRAHRHGLGGGWPTALFWASNLVFLGSIVVMLLVTLLRYRRQDSFADNYFFLLVLPAFLAAKLLLLSDAYFSTGASMSLGLFRMAFLVMLERTLTQFMKGCSRWTSCAARGWTWRSN
jgi:uncharacterized protein involved in response to NO